MGGKNSASFFQQTMQEVLGDLVYVSVLIYIDDVLVYAENFEELTDGAQMPEPKECIKVVRAYTESDNMGETKQSGGDRNEGDPLRGAGGREQVRGIIKQHC